MHFKFILISFDVIFYATVKHFELLYVPTVLYNKCVFFMLVQEEQPQSNTTGLLQSEDSFSEEESMVCICPSGCDFTLRATNVWPPAPQGGEKSIQELHDTLCGSKNKS